MDALQRLGIDGWSLLLYLVNYGILFLVLGRWIYKPLMKMMDERTERIRGNLEEAERLKGTFQKEMDRRTQENDTFVKSMQLELMHARTEAETRAKAMIAEAEARREVLMTKTHEEIAVMKKRIVADVERELLGKIEAIALAAMRSDHVRTEALASSVKQAWDDVKRSV